jgi:hypothetical protein
VKLRVNAEAAFLLSAGPLIDDNKVNVGSIVTLTAITERKLAEEQLTTMMAELNHRVKNILVMGVGGRSNRALIRPRSKISPTHSPAASKHWRSRTTSSLRRAGSASG